MKLKVKISSSVGWQFSYWPIK